MTQGVYQGRQVLIPLEIPVESLLDQCLLLFKIPSESPRTVFLDDSVGKDQPITRSDFFDFVSDIGIPSKSCNVECGHWACCIDAVLPGVREMDLAAFVFGGKTDDETAYHAWCFGRIPVALGERTLLVQEEFIGFNVDIFRR